MSEEGHKHWFVRALIVLGIVAAALGVLLPLVVDSPPYPQGGEVQSRSLVDRVLGR